MARRQRPPGVGSPLDRIRELATLLDEYALSAISASWADVRVRLERNPAPAALPPSPAAPPTPSPVTATKAEPAETSPSTQLKIESPMVGTFYRAPSPGADPYVREGDIIKEGQILCIIEAMKLMNEIEAKVAGRIIKTLAENGLAVEYGQPLFLVEPLR